MPLSSFAWGRPPDLCRGLYRIGINLLMPFYCFMNDPASIYLID